MRMRGAIRSGVPTGSDPAVIRGWRFVDRSRRALAWDVRPLQGQSPWVIDAQLSYENPDIRSNIALLYNVFGPRITSVGSSGIPDVYDQPQHVVDVVWTQGFTKHYQL